MPKKIDTAGMWTIKGNPITHDGIAMYSGKSIDPDNQHGLDPSKLYPVLRPFAELSKAAESFNGKPLINNHEMIGTAEGLTHPDVKNIGGTIYNCRPSADQQGVIIADLSIFSAEIQNLVQSGKCELSLGYYCKYRPEVGVYNNERYEFVQYDLEGNHIALVDAGRMGSGVRVFDSNDKTKTLVFDQMEIQEMTKKKTLDADELRKEVAALLKEASDETLAKCKDILAPANEGDEDDPDKGKEKPNKAGDSAPTMKDMLKEFSHREKLYAAVEPHTGAFDHDEMTTAEVAKYAAEKMGIATVDGAEVAIVEAHLSALGKNAPTGKKIDTGDTAESGDSDMPSEALQKFIGA